MLEFMLDTATTKIGEIALFLNSQHCQGQMDISGKPSLWRAERISLHSIMLQDRKKLTLQDFWLFGMDRKSKTSMPLMKL